MTPLGYWGHTDANRSKCGGDSRGRLCAYVVKGDVSSRRSLRPSPRDALAPRWTRQQAHFCGKKAPLAAGPSQGGKRPKGTHDLCIAQVGGRMVAFYWITSSAVANSTLTGREA